MPTQPNLVFILTDQMRAQATGYAGDPNVKTPNLDRLESESLNFTTAVSTCPVCTPHRASLLTGQYPLTHGMFTGGPGPAEYYGLRDDGHSLAQVYKRNGYDTAYIGKWHLDYRGKLAYITPERRQGFDYFKAAECCHDFNDSKYYDNDDPEMKTWEGYDAYAQTDDAVRYIASRKEETKPYVLFVSYGTPHMPYDTAPKDLKQLYPVAQIELPPNVPPHLHEHSRGQHQGYYAHITALDQCVERIDRALQDAGHAERTMVVFTSDHGDVLDAHLQFQGDPRKEKRYYGSKQSPFDESIRVPFLLRYPERSSSGRRIPVPFGTPDIMPTLLGMSGLEIPSSVEGRDFTPVVEGVAEGPESTLHACYVPHGAYCTRDGGRPHRGIRTERYTYARDRNGPWLLYDNQEDPFQLNNLLNLPEHAELQARMDKELARILDEQGDAFERPEDLLKRYDYCVDDQGRPIDRQRKGR